MTDQNQTSSANQPNHKNRPKLKEAAIAAEQVGQQSGLVHLSTGPIIGVEVADSRIVPETLLRGRQGVFGGGSVENQIARLNDPRLSTVQRQALAVKIGHAQGNRHLGRVMAAIKGADKTATSSSNVPNPSVGPTGEVVMKKQAGGHRAAVSGKAEPVMPIGEEILEESLVHSGPPAMASGEPPPADEQTNPTENGSGQVQIVQFNDRRRPGVQRQAVIAQSEPGQGKSYLEMRGQSPTGPVGRNGQMKPPALAMSRTRTGSGIIQRFEAQHHEHVERGALAKPGADGGPGFTDAEASATYFGNWGRDLSQAFSHNPITDIFGRELVFEILNVLAISKFGRELNPKDFGVYSPREHIDNPVGQINEDLLNAGERGFSQFSQKFQIDQPGHPKPDEDISSEAAVNKLFTVNAAGLPAYLGRSIQYIEEEFSQAAKLGRTEDGLMHFGNGLHTVEDLYAHSNFIEIAVGELYNSGQLTLDAHLTEELESRKGKGLDAIETLSGKVADSKRKDKVRPILTTGTFVTTDTLVSLSEAVTALFAEIDPFSASNSAKSQQTIHMVLSRYEKLAASGDAGRIIQPFMTNFGELLTTTLAEKAEKAIAGEASEESGWGDKIASTARGLAGKVVGGALRLGGELMSSDWVKGMIGQAINSFGQLPLVEIHQFIIDKQSRLKAFFKDIDQRLQDLPFYNEVKSFVKGQVDALREALKPIIQKAFAFVGELLQTAFAEAMAAATNIEAQIDGIIYGAVKNSEKRGELARASPEEKARLLSNPAWCAEAGIEDKDLEQLKKRAELDKASFEEQKRMLTDPAWLKDAGWDIKDPNHQKELERLRQMLQSPEYVRAGPSHTQIAKDHADSPFFGAAAVLAGSAVTSLRDMMIAIWTAEDKNTQKKEKLQENYEIPPDIQKRRPPPGKPESEWSPDERRAEREAQKASPHYKDIKRREEGEELLRQGAIPEGEESHGAEAAYDHLVQLVKELAKQALELGNTMRRLADRLDTAGPDTAAELRRLAGELPQGLENVADQIEGATDGTQMKSLAKRLRQLAHDKEGLVKRAGSVLRGAADQAEQVDLHDVANELRALAGPVEKVMPEVGKVLNELAKELEEWGDRKLYSEAQLDQLHKLDPVKTGEWAPELAESHAEAGSPQRQKLFSYLREEIFAHPYDSKWWRPILLGWCQANKERLEAYIIARNEGDMHHHH